MAKEKARVAVLVSGGGTNLQAIIDAEKAGVIKSADLVLVVSNNPDAYALKRAESAKIDSAVISSREFPGQEDFERALIKKLEEYEVDLIVLAGFMTILSAEFTSHFKNRMINVHPSLIPSFCGQGYYGLKVHEAALEKGVKVTGATVHFVNEIPDGGEIIAQKAVEVSEGDTPELLQRRVMEEAEWKILPAAVEKVSAQLAGER